jgi:hypothetical protein
MTEEERSISEGNTSIEDLIIRFGVMAVKKGFITPEQVVQALQIQVAENFSIGRHRLIGRILLGQDLITFSQLDQVLKAMDEAQEKGFKERRGR